MLSFSSSSLGLLSDEPVLQQKTPLDTLCLYLTEKLAYGMLKRTSCRLFYILFPSSWTNILTLRGRCLKKLFMVAVIIMLSQLILFPSILRMFKQLIFSFFFTSGEGERDMVLLQHDIGLELPDKTQVCHCHHMLIC